MVTSYLVKLMITLIFTATQMWCLAQFLLLMIGDNVPEDDLYWENFLTHLSIIDYLFTPVCTSTIADYVSMLIEDFLTEFKDLYSDRSLTPKCTL